MKVTKNVQRFQDTERRAGLKALIRYFCVVQLLSQVRVFVTTGSYIYSRLTQESLSQETPSPSVTCTDLWPVILQLFVLSLTEWAASMSWVSGSPTTQSQDGFKHFTTPTAALSRLDVFHPEILTVGPPNDPSYKSGWGHQLTNSTVLSTFNSGFLNLDDIDILGPDNS